MDQLAPRHRHGVAWPCSGVHFSGDICALLRLVDTRHDGFVKR